MADDGDRERGTVRVFRKRPYLDKRGREIVNRSSRRIARYRPEYVNDPSEPSATEILLELQHHAATAKPLLGEDLSDLVYRGERDDDPPSPRPVDLSADEAIIVSLLGEGLTFKEVVCWLLYEYSGLDPSEVHHAIDGKSKSFSRSDDEESIRAIRATLRRAAEKLGEEFVLAEDRTVYYDSASDRTGDSEASD